MGDENATAGEDIARAILVARDRAVLLDVELARLYGVTTGALNQSVKRNLARFPADYPRAIQMSVLVVRAFAHLISAARANAQIMEQLERLESRVGGHDADIAALLRAMRKLIGTANTPSRGIGFLADIK
jgi:hypothetical protein